MRGIAVPVLADPVEGPTVTYGVGPASINLMTRDERWARVTFDNLDSLRVSRGEHDPYPNDWQEGEPLHWVSIVAPSPWLRERYAYEKRHYGQAYQFGGDVDEMLRDFSHYLFRFHDQFVEVLCRGIWFEVADEPLGNRDPDSKHPLLDLPPSFVSESFEAHGIRCQVRRNPRPLGEIIKDAELCSQKLFQFAAELDGAANVTWTAAVRVRDGRVRSVLQSYFGKVERTFDGVATLEDTRPCVEEWLREVKDRRARMKTG
ncbi:MAG: hypothetical protein SF182_25315 [Deltaproteobacteria bacterium]|nr:hypothetical protein [Deltaproteobacteria bacterium]